MRNAYACAVSFRGKCEYAIGAAESIAKTSRRKRADHGHLFTLFAGVIYGGESRILNAVALVAAVSRGAALKLLRICMQLP